MRDNRHSAKTAKNDEFYTQYSDIQKELNAYLAYNADTFRGKVVLLPCDDPEWSNFTRFFAQNFKRQTSDKTEIKHAEMLDIAAFIACFI